MPGARELIEALQSRGILVAIVSAGVDLLIGSIAKLLKVDDWVSNGFRYDDDGFLLDDGEVRVPAHHKDAMVEKLVRIHNLDPSEIVSIGDNHTDLSMRIPGSGFIGFNGQKQIAIDGFVEAGVPHVQEKDCRLLWPHLFEGESFPAVGGE
jgi:phosphoserine phosphatase